VALTFLFRFVIKIYDCKIQPDLTNLRGSFTKNKYLQALVCYAPIVYRLLKKEPFCCRKYLKVRLFYLYRQNSAAPMLSRQTAARSTSNLTTVSSVSSTSLASSTGGNSKKRRAPPPPSVLPLKPQEEIEEEGSESSSSVSHGLVSSQSRESRQSSVEVEVDVHHHSERKGSSDFSSSTPISVNESKEILSSSPASSLSSPASSTGSTSSSPLPRMDSPSSKPLPNHGSSQYSSASKDSSSASTASKSDPVANNDSSNPNSLQSIEDSGRSSSSPSSGQGKPFSAKRPLQLTSSDSRDNEEESPKKWDNFLSNLNNILQKRAEFI
jgi:hypothetical protein